MNNGDLPVCPPAPVKRRDQPRSRPNLQDEPHLDCARRICYDAHDDSRPVTQALAPKKKSPTAELSLRANQGILPRPFQSRARRNIMRSLRTYRNMVRIFGVEDPAVNWINLNTIHTIQINRAGNLPGPAKPRKSRDEATSESENWPETTKRREDWTSATVKVKRTPMTVALHPDNRFLLRNELVDLYATLINLIKNYKEKKQIMDNFALLFWGKSSGK
ncbi:hypothetical protein EGW08_022698 [Elysia chlorotica]|uniref:Uncharacterized protein n=1 Tax=Elysia chlorotica TaxID=188477 RepID=A0A433SK86_ELYCH|nr:hypothetical protein EGW08_022698 [Elysia chlorotica]